MTRIDVQTVAPARAGSAPAAADGAAIEAAGDLFERCFPSTPERGGRGGEGKAPPEMADPLAVAAETPAEGPPKGLAALASLVFDLGRGGPDIRAPGAPLSGESEPASGEAAPSEPGDILAGLLAGARDASEPARPRPPEGSPARAAAALAGEGAADGQPVAGPREPHLARFPGAADFALAVKAAKGDEPMRATVLAQATHFAPVLGATNIQAIADAVAGAAPERAPVSFAPGLASTDPLARGAAAPVKTLTIQLEPVSLGKVTLAIRLTADGLRVDVMAADPKVVPLLNQDRELILDAIRRSGVVPDVVTIQAGDAPARLAAPGVPAATPGDAPSGGGSQNASGGREGASGGSERRDQPGPGAQNRRPPHEDDENRRRAPRGDLYL